MSTNGGFDRSCFISGRLARSGVVPRGHAVYGMQEVSAAASRRTIRHAGSSGLIHWFKPARPPIRSLS